MPAIAETWVEEVLQEGIQQGIQLGIQQGIQQNLRQNTEQLAAHATNALRKRFGAIDRNLQWQIRALTFDKLGELIESIFDFQTVEDVSAWIKEHFFKEIIEEHSMWIKEYVDMIREAGGDMQIAPYRKP